MAWIDYIPLDTRGPGRPRNQPASHVYAAGQMTLNHEATELIGTPYRARMQVEPEQERIRLYPTSPDDSAGWTISGGGNTQRRITVRKLIKEFPQMVGTYSVHKIARGIELRKETK